MIELEYTPQLRESVGVAAQASAPALDATVLPELPNLVWDETFTAVELPGRTDIAGPTSPRDVSERWTLDTSPGSCTYLVRGQVDEDNLDALVAAALSSPGVTAAGVFADLPVEPTSICPGDPPMGNDADVAKLLCAPTLHERGMDGAGVLVAIVDTGINLEYLASRGKTPQFDATRSWGPVANLPLGSMPVNHGTMCAYDATIAAPNCTLLDIALLQSTAGRLTGFLSDAVRAYRHLLDVMTAEQRPGECRSLVVNNSWGVFRPDLDFPPNDPRNYTDNPNHPFNRIVGLLERTGADIVFAAGNCGADCPDGRCGDHTDNTINGANSHPQVLTVAGVDVTKNRVGYSSIGPGRLERRKPDISGYTHFRGSLVFPADGGTSAAAPVVSGVVAALRTLLPFNELDPESSPAAVRDRLVKTAEDRGAVGFDFEYGWGIVNGCRLVDSDEPCEDRRRCRCCCVVCCTCGGTKLLPDLVPVPRPGTRADFCRREGDKLLVVVKNQGAGHAAQSVTTVDFGSHGSVSQSTPALAPGAPATLEFEIPRGCFDADCGFVITVDATGVVAESNETNNTAAGRCLG